MMLAQNNTAATLDRAASRLLHVRFAGRSFDIPLVGLDLDSYADDVRVKHVVANHLEVAERRLDDYVIDRHANGNLTLRPPAVFG